MALESPNPLVSPNRLDPREGRKESQPEVTLVGMDSAKLTGSHRGTAGCRTATVGNGGHHPASRATGTAAGGGDSAGAARRFHDRAAGYPGYGRGYGPRPMPYGGRGQFAANNPNLRPNFPKPEQLPNGGNLEGRGGVGGPGGIGGRGGVGGPGSVGGRGRRRQSRWWCRWESARQSCLQPARCQARDPASQQSHAWLWRWRTRQPGRP